MKMSISEKCVFNNRDDSTVKELVFDSLNPCDRNLFIRELEAWSILFKYYIKPCRKSCLRKGSKINVTFSFEF